MKITFNYFAQIRQKAGTESETVSVADGATAIEALKAIDHGAEFAGLLFDESGALRPVILLVVNDVPAASDKVLNDGDRVQIFSPVAGG
jgi:molybdopterin converting factor small subunit